MSNGDRASREVPRLAVCFLSIHLLKIKFFIPSSDPSDCTVIIQRHLGGNKPSNQWVVGIIGRRNKQTSEKRNLGYLNLYSKGPKNIETWKTSEYVGRPYSFRLVSLSIDCQE